MQTNSKRLQDANAFLAQLRAHFTLASEAESEIRREALSDFEFRAGQQWDPEVEAQRDAEGRPCFTLNRIPQFVKQVVSQQRQNRQAIQVSPVGDGADKDTAEIIQGATRHVELNSNGDVAYTTAFDAAATGGFGYFRILTDYCDPMSFDQEAKFSRILNPFTVYFDPGAQEPDYSDARFCFVMDQMVREDFEEAYPDSELVGMQDFASLGDRAPGWLERDRVRVCEYFWVELQDETLVKLADGKTAIKSQLPAGAKLAKDRNGKTIQRSTQVRKVFWAKTNGMEVLEHEEVPCEWIPIVPVLGDEFIVNGKRHLVGVVRYAREPQRMYNLWQSAMAESIALAPKAPWVATPKQVEGFSDIWETANRKAYPYLPYNPDPGAPPPQRQFAEPPIEAIQVAIQHADNDLKTTTGLYDASLGAPGPEQSGKAILLRQKQGDQANFGLLDNMGRAIRHAGRILLSIFQHIYDAPRMIRIVQPDETHDTVHINQLVQEGAVQKIFDFTCGKYDVTISQGPSFASKREEAANSIMQLVQAFPQLMQVAGDLLTKNFDWPYATEISERLKKTLPPQLQDNEDGQQQIPPQVQAQMAALGQQHAQLVALVQQLKQERDGKTLELQSQERRTAWQVQAQLVTALAKIESTDAQARADREYDRLNQMFDAAHDTGMAAMQQAHTQQNAQQQAALQPAAGPSSPAAPTQPQAQSPAPVLVTK